MAQTMNNQTQQRQPTSASQPEGPETTLVRWLMPSLLGIVALLLLVSVEPALSDHAAYALSFDGNNDYVQLYETALMMHDDWEEAKTISLWVKPIASSPCQGPYPLAPDCDMILGDRERWFGITIGERQGQDKIWLWNWDGSPDTIGVDYTPGNWVHIALVHEGGMLSAYRNGYLVSSIPSGATLQPNTGAQPILHLGGMINNPSVNLTFTGLIDEVRIWNYGRTQSQLQADMFQHLNGDEPGLAAYYQMSDGSGLTLSDDSVNSWNGTLHDGGQGVPEDGSPPQWVTSDAFETQIDTPTPTSTVPGPTPTPTVTGTPPAPTPSTTPGSVPDDPLVHLPMFTYGDATP
jgi:hypothetical protein